MAEAAEMKGQLNYRAVREEGQPWIAPGPCGIISVSGGEAVQFLNGLVTNDVAKLDDGRWVAAAFPNVKGRLVAVCKLIRRGDDYVFITEEATYGAVLSNLERFTFAGDFNVADQSEEQSAVRVYGRNAASILGDLLGTKLTGLGSGEVAAASRSGSEAEVTKTVTGHGFEIRLPQSVSGELIRDLEAEGCVVPDEDLLETLRIEEGIPVFGRDMNEDTVVPETGIGGLISYEKGCYIGQEVIARIHFLGKVAKQLVGVRFAEGPTDVESGSTLESTEGKNAGYLTSVAYSPSLGATIALAYVRNAFLEEGTELVCGGQSCRVSGLPFIEQP